MSHSLDAATLPARIGRFAIRASLGSGAFAAVYRAFDPHLQREVALKLPHPGVLADPALRERFLREARTAAGLRHPHILPVFAAGEAGGRLYLATAFVSGGTLADLAQDQGLDFRGSARIVRDLAGALAYAHAEGVVHRDVKPDNILLDADGTAYLADFGLAFRQEAADRLTHDGDVLGTPAYIAPEQARAVASEPLPASDQYSLGAVLYELLTGRPPFAGEAAAVLAQVLTEAPPAPRTLKRRVPRDLETICLKCLAKRPEDRYADCGALADDLRRWLDGEPIRARRLGVAERLVRWCRRQPRLAFVVLAAALALVAAAVAPLVASAWLAVALRQEDAARDQASRQADRAREQAEQADRQRQRAQEAAREAEQAIRDAGQAAAEARVRTAQAGKETVAARQEERRAEEGRRNVARYRYVAEINLLARAIADDDAAGAARLLDSARAAAEESCGFEWRYFRGRIRRVPEYASLPFAAERLSVRGDIVTTAGFVAPESSGGSLDLVLEPRKLAGGDLPDGSFRYLLRAVPAARRDSALERVSGDGMQALTDESATRARWAHAERGDMRLSGFPRSVTAVAFSNSGDRLGTAHGSEEARLWEWDRSGRSVGGVPLPVKGVASLAFSPDARLLATVSDRVRLWDVSARKETPVEIQTHAPPHGDVRFSPDGKTLAVSSGQDVEVFETVSGKALARCPDARQALRFSADGARLAAWNGKEVLVLDAHGGNTLLSLSKVGAVRDALFTPDGRFLAVILERMVSVVSIPGGQQRVVFDRGRDGAPLAAFTADGRKLLVGTGNIVTVHDATEWDRPHVVTGLPNSVASLVVAGKDAVAVPEGKGVVLRDLVTGEVRARLTEQAAPVVWLAGAGDSLATAMQDGTVKCWAAGTPPRERGLEGSVVQPAALAISPDGKVVAAAPLGGGLRVWDAATGGHRWDLPDRGIAEAVTALAFGPGDSSDLFVADARGVMRRLETSEGKERQRIAGPAGRVHALAVSPDGKCLAAGCENGTVRLWNLEDGKERAMLKGHTGAVRALTFSPDGKTLVSGGADKLLHLWEPATAQELAALPGHEGAVLALAFTPDGRLLLSGGADRTIRWWHGE